MTWSDEVEAENIRAAEEATTPEVGDIVRIGMGHKQWRVQSFWTSAATNFRYASLGPLDSIGYSTTSADPERLTIVTKAGES